MLLTCRADATLQEEEKKTAAASNKKAGAWGGLPGRR
jgi:hypothetical protein